jgi:HSP20 family protein
MALVKRETPKGETETLEPRFIDRLFDEIPEVFRRPFVVLSERGINPFNAEEFTEDGTLVVRVELPGIDPDTDIDLTIDDGTLRLKAERREDEKTEGRDYERREISYGSFRRELPIPRGTHVEDVKATYSDGILEVRVPLKHEDTDGPKRVNVARL